MVVCSLCGYLENTLQFIAGDPKFTMATALLSGTALLLQFRTREQLNTRDEYFALTDSAREQSMSLTRRNRELMEKQDYEVRLATLRERNRIAREIHDNGWIARMGSISSLWCQKRLANNE